VHAQKGRDVQKLIAYNHHRTFNLRVECSWSGLH